MNGPPGHEAGGDEQEPATTLESEAGSVVDPVIGGLAGIGEPAPAPRCLEAEAIPNPSGRAGSGGDALRQGRDTETEFHETTWVGTSPERWKSWRPVWRIRSPWETHSRHSLGMAETPSLAPSSAPTMAPLVSVSPP